MYNYKNILVSMLILLSSSIFLNADVTTESTNTINITNDTESRLNIDFSVPEQTEALIKFKNLNLLQDSLHQGIAAN